MCPRMRDVYSVPIPLRGKHQLTISLYFDNGLWRENTRIRRVLDERGDGQEGAIDARARPGRAAGAEPGRQEVALDLDARRPAARPALHSRLHSSQGRLSNPLGAVSRDRGMGG